MTLVILMGLFPSGLLSLPNGSQGHLAESRERENSSESSLEDLIALLEQTQWHLAALRLFCKWGALCDFRA